MRFIVFFVLFFFLIPTPTYAATFRLIPEMQTIAVGEQFEVGVIVESPEKLIHSADVRLAFDSKIIEVVGVNHGDFFAKHQQSIQTDHVSLGAGFIEGGRIGAGLLAHLVIRGKSFGVASLSFVCKPRSIADFTNITDENDEDVVECGSLRNGVYTITVPPGTVLSLSDVSRETPPTPAFFPGILARPLKAGSISLSPIPTLPAGNVLGSQTQRAPSNIPLAISMLLAIAGVVSIVVYRRI